MKVAAICMRSEIGCAKANLERIQALVHTASGKGAEIICLPELCVTGYSLGDPMAAYGSLSPGDAISGWNAWREIRGGLSWPASSSRRIMAGLTSRSWSLGPKVSWGLTGRRTFPRPNRLATALGLPSRFLERERWSSGSTLL